MHDIPYIKAKETGPEVVSMMTKICSSVRQLVPEHISCGLQVCSYCIVTFISSIYINTSILDISRSK